NLARHRGGDRAAAFYRVLGVTFKQGLGNRLRVEEQIRHVLSGKSMPSYRFASTTVRSNSPLFRAPMTVSMSSGRATLGASFLPLLGSRKARNERHDAASHLRIVLRSSEPSTSDRTSTIFSPDHFSSGQTN